MDRIVNFLWWQAFRGPKVEVETVEVETVEVETAEVKSGSLKRKSGKVEVTKVQKWKHWKRNEIRTEKGGNGPA